MALPQAFKIVPEQRAMVIRTRCHPEYNRNLNCIKKIIINKCENNIAMTFCMEKHC